MDRDARRARATPPAPRSRPRRREPPHSRRGLHPAGDHRGRSPFRLGGGGVHPGQGRPRRLHGASRSPLPRVRLPAAQGVRDRRASRGARAARARARSTGARFTAWGRRRRASRRVRRSSCRSSDDEPAALERPLVPRFLLAGFADAARPADGRAAGSHAPPARPGRRGGGRARIVCGARRARRPMPPRWPASSPRRTRARPRRSSGSRPACSRRASPIAPASRSSLPGSSCWGGTTAPRPGARPRSSASSSCRRSRRTTTTTKRRRPRR